ncbi:hypothetical protein [Halosegnis sp.]|uniref:DUF7118 family protein n=1 Tax=Halosegnis sp. TaxID=2864959 RepID=UPI0035D48A41
MADARETDATAGTAPDPERIRHRLVVAADEYERVHSRVENAGGESLLRRTAGAYHTFRRLLDDNEEAATGSGFQAYVEFQERVAEHTAGLDDSLPAYEAFEAADDAVHKKRLSAADFEEARAALDPAREYADLLVEWEAAEELLRERRRAARERLDTLAERIADAERLLELGEADLEAPVEQLREPIVAYNERVAADFDRLKRDSSARKTLAVVATAEAYPLVDFREPPTRLAEYVESAPVGEESVTTLLEYADYSAEKLSHLVEDPGALKRHVATNRTYLTNLDATPLQVSYPPPDAETLRYQCEEYARVCGRFADDATLAALRTVRGVPDTVDYERLCEAARALSQLTETDRERLAAGEVSQALGQLEREREALAEQLAAIPEP